MVDKICFYITVCYHGNRFTIGKNEMSLFSPNCIRIICQYIIFPQRFPPGSIWIYSYFSFDFWYFIILLMRIEEMSPRQTFPLWAALSFSVGYWPWLSAYFWCWGDSIFRDLILRFILVVVLIGMAFASRQPLPAKQLPPSFHSTTLPPCRLHAITARTMPLYQPVIMRKALPAQCQLHHSLPPRTQTHFTPFSLCPARFLFCYQNVPPPRQFKVEGISIDYFWRQVRLG